MFMVLQDPRTIALVFFVFNDKPFNSAHDATIFADLDHCSMS